MRLIVNLFGGSVTGIDDAAGVGGVTGLAVWPPSYFAYDCLTGLPTTPLALGEVVVVVVVVGGASASCGKSVSGGV